MEHKNPTEKDCNELLEQLNLTTDDAIIGIGNNKFFVYLYKKKNIQRISTFKNIPVEYKIIGRPKITQ